LYHRNGQSKPWNIQTAQNVACFERRFRLELVGLCLKLELAFQGPLCRCLVELGVEQSETYLTERECQ
jgi:hypothetical protein